MHATPGSIEPDSSPPPHVLPLVQVGGTLNGSGFCVQVPGGMPALTQACIVAIAAAGAAIAGAGGICEPTPFMRSRQRCATVMPAVFVATRSVYVTSGIGAPPLGGFAWQPWHWLSSTFC